MDSFSSDMIYSNQKSLF
jgi:hypothetical protein